MARGQIWQKIPKLLRFMALFPSLHDSRIEAVQQCARYKPRVLLSATQLSGPVLRDTARLSQRYPPVVRYGGFWCLNMADWVRYPLPLFSAFPPWRAGEVEVRYPPPPQKRGISAILARYPFKTRQMGAIPPSAILSRKGIARWGGGVSRIGPLSKARSFARTVPFSSLRPVFNTILPQLRQFYHWQSLASRIQS